MPAGHKSQEAPEVGQTANIRDGADVPFQVRLDVGTEPQPASSGPRQHFRVAAVKEAKARGKSPRSKEVFPARRGPVTTTAGKPRHASSTAGWIARGMKRI